MKMKESISSRLDVVLLSADEQQRRLDRVYAGMAAANISTALVRDNANLYYLTGRVFRGYIYLEAGHAPLYFVRQPTTLHGGDSLHHIRKPEDIAGILVEQGRLTAEASSAHAVPAIELDALSYSDAVRLARVFGSDAPAANLSPILRAARSVKTDEELQALRESGMRQTNVYRRIPRMYREGMSDIELQIEIEYHSRLEGCLGQFRIAGADMELFMGNVLTGENADTPSPYDFAMGGAGIDPSLPVGADGTIIKPGLPVMVDVNGNYTGYMTDMTRCYYITSLESKASEALELSRRICRELAAMMIPGTPAKDLYDRARAIAEEEGMEDYFMGHRSHAGFVGHGVGIEINELPVIAPRSRDVLRAGNVIALEPKFVIPGIGAVGIENTYIVRPEAPGECITLAPEEAVCLN
ncbi:MAG: Xaa-Pro peptidase family protein [Muribaculaceae bacterium]|nr:Xaa-Pro peptidase family protein [Muribaculaceae bacterium]